MRNVFNAQTNDKSGFDTLNFINSITESATPAVEYELLDENGNGVLINGQVPGRFNDNNDKGFPSLTEEG